MDLAVLYSVVGNSVVSSWSEDRHKAMQIFRGAKSPLSTRREKKSPETLKQEGKPIKQADCSCQRQAPKNRK